LIAGTPGKSIFLFELSKLSTESPFITQAKPIIKTDVRNSFLYIIIIEETASLITD